MATLFTSDNLRTLFQSAFSMEDWYNVLQHYFHAQTIRTTPECIFDNSDEESEGFYLGSLDTEDNFHIGLFFYKVKAGSVVNKRVGLRKLVKSFINPRWGEFDAALVVFDSNDHWRLSFVSDMKGENTSPKRYTYVFGEAGNYYNTPVSRFIELQNKGITFGNIKNAFSVEALTKQFYNDLFEWYQWAVKEDTGITFPNNTSIEDDDRENIDIKIIRMITRIMFVWFIKQKGLVPNSLFDPQFLGSILKNFRPTDKTSGNYYNAILQNLFFATLNRAIVDEEGKGRSFAKLVGRKDLKTLYRYAEMFTISEQEVIRLFADIPFLNGGLFECLDKTKTIDGVQRAYYYDGFSRNDSTFADGRSRNRAFVPNELFFLPEKGLYSILSRYNFTIEENTPNEQQVALDPELLGKVFENLLGAYNPETKETARNQSGSFYTPREIVNYMVDESLKSYLGKTPEVLSLFGDDFQKEPGKDAVYNTIARQLKEIKVLDPACGSGAFPMGLLNRMVDILQKINPEESTYQLKLDIIEHCIYGSDIQSIAAQITKLRFFISLVCDCEKDESKPNLGIPTLPNLETKFVAANSLIAKKKKALQGNLFENPEIEPTKTELSRIRHEHFSAKSASRKIHLREMDEKLRTKLANLLSDDNNFAPDDAKQLAAWNPYDQNSVSPFFDAEWMFGIADGFDIVIGNPPYIQLQNNGGALATLYAPCSYQTFARTGDIYSLFYERGWQLLKHGGHLCYITSNKWMRSGYGEATRGFFAEKTNPELLIDFAGIKIFESATVDTNVLLFSKAKNRYKTLSVVMGKQDKESVKELSVFVQQHGVECNFNSSDAWVILSPIEQSIKRKIEAVGTPLKDWDIQINYGIKTGFNDAFIISTEKRDEILANCQTEDERKRTAELIRPILRGRDIKRYGYNWADLWIINTHNGIKGKIPRINVNEYPAIKAHLDQYWDKISKRADKGETPYNLRNGAYMEDFFKPKMVYMEIQTDNPKEGYPFPCFSYDEKGTVALNTAYIMCSDSLDIRYVLGVLNSSMGAFLAKLYVTQLQQRQFRMLAQYVSKFPLPHTTKEDEEAVVNIVNKILKSPSEESERELDYYMFKIYGLSSDEQRVVMENRN